MENTKERIHMDRVVCVKMESAKARAVLQKSVVRVIQRNKKVFDELAKS